jgi:hypothetical protein
MKLIATYDGESKRFHRFTIDPGQEAVGTIYFPKSGGGTPKEITIQQRVKPKDSGNG